MREKKKDKENADELAEEIGELEEEADRLQTKIDRETEKAEKRLGLNKIYKKIDELEGKLNRKNEFCEKCKKYYPKKDCKVDVWSDPSIDSSQTYIDCPKGHQISPEA